MIKKYNIKGELFPKEMKNNNVSYEFLNTQNTLLLDTLTWFYEQDDNLNKLVQIINGDSKISLRIVDWFVTNYAKKNYIVYNDRFKVYNDYKLKLKAYSKKRFDPFCRWDRIYIPYKNITTHDKIKSIPEEAEAEEKRAEGAELKDNQDHKMKMETTIGQLNFFKWAIENKILDYIDIHFSIIEDDMNQRNSSSKRKKKNKKENKTSVDDVEVESETHRKAFGSRDNDENGFEASVESLSRALQRDRYCDASDKKTRKKREELSVSACKYVKKEIVKVIIRLS
jgi:hypothetical protein